MIPMVLAFGVVIGRWWLVPLAAIAWPLLVADLCEPGWKCGFGASALAAVNAAVGVALHQGLRKVFLRDEQRSKDDVK